MREVLNTIISDFQERRLPVCTRRETVFPVLPGKATVVMGMRRVGKTWFCYQRIADLLAEGVEKSRILYLNFDDDRLLDFSLADFQTILDVYYARWPENKERRCYFFFDEIQVIECWETFVRRLLDTEDVQVTLTGSSSKMLSADIATSLRGRTVNCEIFPFSFREILVAKGIFTVIPDHPGSRDVGKLRHALAEYGRWGGFPEVTEADVSLKREIVRSYMETVLFKDVVERHKVANVLALRHLMTAILSQPGQQFSVNKLHNTLKSKGIPCAKNALYEYIDHLVDAYFVHRLPLYSDSARVRQVNPDKMYGNDIALHGLVLNRLGVEQGYALETLVFLHLRRSGRQLFYVRDRENREIDFLTIDPANGKRTLIQVCANISAPETLARELRVFYALPNEIQDAEKIVVTLDDSRDFDGGISAIPVWKFLNA